MPDNTELRIFGTEAQETNSSLVFNDTKLQTLDRRVGKNNLYFDKELFRQSLDAWENIPVIYQKDGIHPDDFDGVSRNPQKAAEAVGGKMVGRVHNPRIVIEGGARLMATLSIEENEAEIEHLWQTGKLFPSTAFSTHSDGDRITSPPVPNHVLIFPIHVDKVVPGDFGAYVNSQEITPMTEETTLDADNLMITTNSEKMSFPQYLKTMISRLLKHHEEEMDPAVEEIPSVPEKPEVPPVAVASSEPDEKAEPTAENTELVHALAERDSLKAELDRLKHAEQEAKFERLLHALPAGMTQTEEQRRTIRDLYDHDMESLVYSVLEAKGGEGTTEKAGVQYTYTEPVSAPFTTVGDLSGKTGDRK